jgi:hypothetical protein
MIDRRLRRWWTRKTKGNCPVLRAYRKRAIQQQRSRIIALSGERGAISLNTQMPLSKAATSSTTRIMDFNLISLVAITAVMLCILALAVESSS